MECTKYVMDEPRYEENWMNLCRCPKCKGWLPREFPDDKPFKCKKCGTELMTFPEVDEETNKELEWGKICPISNGGSPTTPTGEEA